MSLAENTQKLNQLLAAINALPEAGGGDPVLQALTVTPSESEQVFDSTDIDGYFPVTVNPISGTYIGSGVTRKSADEYIPGTADQTIAANQYLTGTQTIKGDANLIADNIKSGVSIFGILGAFAGSGGGGGGLPSGISALDSGTFTPTADITARYDINHNLGVVPDFAIAFVDGDFVFSEHGSGLLTQILLNKTIAAGTTNYGTAIISAFMNASGNAWTTGVSGVAPTYLFLYFNNTRFGILASSTRRLLAGVTYRYIVGKFA